MARVLINLAVFQVGWFVCVLGGNLAALLYTTAALVFHAVYMASGIREWMLILGIAVIGSSWDLLMVNSGQLTFPGTADPGLPLWMLCLWLLFATTFNHCLAWLQSRLAIAGLLAALFGPLTYWAGSYFSGAQLAGPTAIVVIACGWLLLFPCGLYWARQLRYA